MAPEDEEKTAFYTPVGIYCYTIMPYGPKNADATYQRVMQFIFADMIHEEMEDYVDDIFVKSKTRLDILIPCRKSYNDGESISYASILANVPLE